MKIGLISCAEKKLQIKCPAKFMYMASPRFALLYQIAKNQCDEIYIISGKHGLISENTIIEPYEQKINSQKINEVNLQLKSLVSIYSFEAWLGGNYKKAIQGLEIVNHLEGKGIFEFAATTPGGLRMKQFDWPMWHVLYHSLGRTEEEIISYLKINGYAIKTISAQLARLKRCPILVIKEGKYCSIYE